MKGTCVKIVLALALLVGFTCGTVFAQTFDIWDGSLWKMKQTAKGYYFEDENAPVSPAKVRGTEQVWGIMTADATGENMSIVIYEAVGGGACELVDTITLLKKAGGPLEFFATFEMDVVDEIYATGLFSFTAKLKNNEFQKGKMTTLGAYALEQGFDVEEDLAVVGINISGTTVPEQAFKCPLP